MTPLEAAKAGKNEAKYPVFPPDYSGLTLWAVTHPAYRAPVIVRAPNEVAALVAAANWWDTNWKRWRFYGNATVAKY